MKFHNRINILIFGFIKKIFDSITKLLLTWLLTSPAMSLLLIWQCLLTWQLWQLWQLPRVTTTSAVMQCHVSNDDVVVPRHRWRGADNFFFFGDFFFKEWFYYQKKYMFLSCFVYKEVLSRKVIVIVLLSIFYSTTKIFITLVFEKKIVVAPFLV